MLAIAIIAGLLALACSAWLIFRPLPVDFTLLALAGILIFGFIAVFTGAKALQNNDQTGPTPNVSTSATP